MAGWLGRDVDKDMTTHTPSAHKDTWKRSHDTVWRQLVPPGFRKDYFDRLKDNQLNALKENLRNTNEEELGKEELYNRIYAGTPYGHTPLGTVAGITTITLDDVKQFVAANYTSSNVVIGISGDYPDDLATRITG